MNLFGDDLSEDDGDNEEDFHFDIDLSPYEASEGLQPPQNSDFIVGHEIIERSILSLWNSGRMPHALVFNGLKGIGKATFAYRLARFILKESSENTANSLFGKDVAPDDMSIARDHPVFSKVSSGGHPDLMVVTRPFDEKKGRYKDDIPVDDIRKVAPFLRKTSSNGGWRVVIIDDANTMTLNGQNALLKILEEPPKNALLILVTHGAGGLLPTIRSRCRFMTFSPLDKDSLNSVLERASEGSTKRADMEIITSLSEGSAGQAEKLIKGEGLSQIRVILDALEQIENLSHDQIDTLALSYGKSGDAIAVQHFIFILNWWLEKRIQMAASGCKNYEVGGLSLHIPQGTTLQSLLRLHEDVAEHIETCINGALDKRYMIYKALRMVQGSA